MTSQLCRRHAAASCRIDIHTIVDSFDESIRTAQLQAAKLHHYVATHFLVWLQLNGIELQSVDGETLERFLHHRCHCRETESPLSRLRRRKSHCNRLELLRFIRFLEQAGYILTPGDLQANVTLANRFVEQVRAQGYAESTMQLYRGAVFNLIIWLHFFRIALQDLTPQALMRYRARRFRCVIPGLFESHSERFSKLHHYPETRFIDHLVESGRVDAINSSNRQPPLPAVLEDFSEWLEHGRGASAATISIYLDEVAGALPQMGEDLSKYEAKMVQQVCWQKVQGRSPNYACRFLKAFRMYLRFVALRHGVSATLIDAVPTVARWRLAHLPDYIGDDDVERAINACPKTDAGVRDRAILLLLARLALRASDIKALRLDDVDWARAQLRVSGKSHRQDLLPLPQDVGEALYAYIATVRPKVDAEHVFLLVNAPYRPFAKSSQVGRIASVALDRAGVVTRGRRGAHLFRHSRATSLLRSGASLNAIQALLRHRSADTTMIYAKTDTTMLQAIAQPWISGESS